MNQWAVCITDRAGEAVGCLHHGTGRVEEPVGHLHYGTGEGRGTSGPSGCHREGGGTTGAAGSK